MFIAILAGLVVGFILAMPPGPVGVTLIRYGLYENIKPGISFALGVAFMDVIYCLIAIFAASAAESAVENFSTAHPYILLFIQILIVIFFLIYGIINIRAKDKNDLEPKPDKIHSKFLDNLKTKGPFLLGVAIALANLPNPAFLPSLAWVMVSVHQLKLIENTMLSNTIFSFAYGIGNMIWFYLLLKVIIYFRPRMSALTIIRIRQFAGVTFIGFGTFLGYRIITVVKWQEIFRLVFTV